MGEDNKNGLENNHSDKQPDKKPDKRRTDNHSDSHSDKKHTDQDHSPKNWFGKLGLDKSATYLLVGSLIILLIIGLLMTAQEKGNGNGKTKATVDENPQGQEKTEEALGEEYKVNENEDILKLMKSYYKAYAAGDLDTLTKIATPITDLEQSYIKMFSKRIEAYKSIKCYVKDGLDEGSYVVSVTMNMKFPDIETKVPSLETFYIRTNEDQTLYIDNLYSTFNYVATQEKEVDETIANYMKNYEEQEDFTALAKTIEEKSKEAIASDEALSAYIDKLNNKVIPKWLKKYQKKVEKQAAEEQKKAEEAQAAEEQKKAEEQAAEEQKKAEEQAAEEQKKAEEQAAEAAQQAETVYATDSVNIRDAADTSGNLLTTVDSGTEMKRTGTEGDWSIVEYNGTTGYVKSEYLSTEVPQQNTAAALPEGSTVTLDTTINIRESMSENAKKVAIGYAGDQVTVVMSYAEGWTKVNYKDTIGYIKTELLQ